MRIAVLTASVIAALLASGCAWVKLEPGAQAVRVARAGEDLSSCARAGEIAVSVRDKVGFYERDDLTVRDELETLARNEADALRADTIQPLGPPLAGEQRFIGWRCGTAGRAAAADADRAATRPAGVPTAPVQGAQTAPVQGAQTTPLQGAQTAPVQGARTAPVVERSSNPATEPLAPRGTQGFEPIDDDDDG